MVAGAFPVIKLATLAFKQVSKPVAGWLRERAKSSHFFRTYICMPPAQFYHWVEVNVKMRILNLGKPAEVPKLNEAMAIELGAQMLGEAVIFVFAAGALTFEYVRSSNKEKEKEASKEELIQSMMNDINELQFTTEKQDAEIRHLTRLVYALEPKAAKSNIDESQKKSTVDKIRSIENAIINAKIGIGSK